MWLETPRDKITPRDAGKGLLLSGSLAGASCGCSCGSGHFQKIISTFTGLPWSLPVYRCQCSPLMLNDGRTLSNSPCYPKYQHFLLFLCQLQPPAAALGWGFTPALAPCPSWPSNITSSLLPTVFPLLFTASSSLAGEGIFSLLLSSTQFPFLAAAFPCSCSSIHPFCLQVAGVIPSSW